MTDNRRRAPLGCLGHAGVEVGPRLLLANLASSHPEWPVRVAAVEALVAVAPGVDAGLWIDPADWKMAVDTIRAASIELCHRARPPHTPDTIEVSASALLFPMTVPAPPAPGRE